MMVHFATDFEFVSIDLNVNIETGRSLDSNLLTSAWSFRIPRQKPLHNVVVLDQQIF